MVRWKAGRRGVLAAAVVSVIGGGLLALPLTSAQAEMAQVDLIYRCRDTPGQPNLPNPLVSNPVDLKITLTVQTALSVGQPLDVKWNIAYENGTRFLSPGLFQPGARLSATGKVGVLGEKWQGELHSLGAKDQELLQAGGPLTLPELISGAVSTTDKGVFEIEPRDLLIDFTPPPSEKVVNDDDLSKISYDANWIDFNDRDPKFHDIHEDVHATEVGGAKATFQFTGTGVDFITEQDHRAGEVDFKIDGKPGIPATADASKDADGNPVVVVNQGNHTLWGMRGLPYGPHTLEVTNLENKWMMVDGFRAVTEQLLGPPKQFQATCKPVKKPTAIRVVIGGGNSTSGPSTSPSGPDGPPASPDQSPSGTPGEHSPGQSTPMRTPSFSPRPTVTVTATATAAAGASPSPTATTTVTMTATPTVAQVEVTPKGGAQTGEAPEQTSSGGLLLGSGGLMLLVGVWGGVAMLRRRAAHSGDSSATR
ncbi:hypothetical protein [Sphaerimonospora thailandensis]|uniref:LPXTG-motif cell wall-anchored protein n=1 Tax=Sphaerimonospora thailandensis TaxID=795644 RepID=A0A8J3R7S0_9ACTN|nr:hypothetical protein [Sphaerimonospora thailandensis]GIH69599.1 hypothetical protein Mth01_18520 [Sphaerimonospora thailandensis]